MCQALIDIWDEGYELGFSDGVDKARVEAILNAMDGFHVTLDEAMKVFEIPEEEWDRYREMVEKIKEEQESNV